MKTDIKRGEVYKIIVIGLLLTSAFYIGKANGDPNSGLIYGGTGLPRNCRAIIDSNIQGWRTGEFTAEGALGSIERNCGGAGYSWGW